MTSPQCSPVTTKCTSPQQAADNWLSAPRALVAWINDNKKTREVAPSYCHGEGHEGNLIHSVESEGRQGNVIKVGGFALTSVFFPHTTQTHATYTRCSEAHRCRGGYRRRFSRSPTTRAYAKQSLFDEHGEQQQPPPRPYPQQRLRDIATQPDSGAFATDGTSTEYPSDYERYTQHA